MLPIKDIMRSLFGEYWLIIAISIPIFLYFCYYILRYFYKVDYYRFTVGQLDYDMRIEFMSKQDFLRKLARKIFVFLFLAYSASFLAAVLPADPQDPIGSVIYTIGAIVYGLYLSHLLFFIWAYRRWHNHKVRFTPTSLYWEKKEPDGRVIGGELSAIHPIIVQERLNCLILSDEIHSIIIPLFLIKQKNQRQALLKLFQPQTPHLHDKGIQGLEIFESVIIAIILAMHIRQFAVQAFYIPSGSMELTLRVGDHLLVDKLSLGPYFPAILGKEESTHLEAFAFSSIKRGDIIVFRPPIPNEHREFIKRVVGMPGETFEIVNGNVFINGERLPEPYLGNYDYICEDYYLYLKENDSMSFSFSNDCPMDTSTSYQTGFHGKVEIPQDMYLMLGDHRDNSSDSRTWGLVPRKNIKGKAWILYFNYFDFVIKKDFSRFGFIQ